MDIKSILEQLKEKQNRITLAITLVESLEELLAKAGLSDIDTDKTPKKLHWTQRPDGKAKMAKAARKMARTKKKNA